jgi:dihydrofolate reductase
MGKLIVEQIVSADGYAAEPDGGIGFFESEVTSINEADGDQLRMLESVRAIVLGRTTYRMFADYWPDADPADEPVAAPLNTIPKYVVSNTLDDAPWGRHAPAQVLRGDGVDSVRDLRSRIDGNLVVWGSLSLADALLRAGEVDLLRLRIVPRLIGAGRSFTPSDPDQRELVLEHSKAYPRGIVVLQYRFA